MRGRNRSVLQGDRVGKFLILKSGICQNTHLKSSGNLEKTFSLSSGCSFLCASAHICRLEYYPISAIAYSDVAICGIPWEEAYKLFLDRPNLLFCLLKCISGELIGTYNQSLDFSLNIKYRVARFLMLQNDYGMLCYHDYNKETELQISHEMIASILGVTRPVISMALQELENLGLIRKEYKRIIIISHKKLCEYCEKYLENCDE